MGWGGEGWDRVERNASAEGDKAVSSVVEKSGMARDGMKKEQGKKE